MFLLVSCFFIKHLNTLHIMSIDSDKILQYPQSLHTTKTISTGKRVSHIITQMHAAKSQHFTGIRTRSNTNSVKEHPEACFFVESRLCQGGNHWTKLI